jgi:MFS family permease
MIGNQRGRRWLLIAAIAIGIAVLLLILVPHAHSADNGVWQAILPIFFVGVISSLSLLLPLAYLYLGRIPKTPVHPTSFQRPPPFRMA